jgi:hypothetical protein
MRRLGVLTRARFAGSLIVCVISPLFLANNACHRIQLADTAWRRVQLPGHWHLLAAALSFASAAPISQAGSADWPATGQPAGGDPASVEHELGLLLTLGLACEGSVTERPPTERPDAVSGPALQCLGRSQDFTGESIVQ